MKRVLLAAGPCLLLLLLAYENIVFRGQTLVLGNNALLFDDRPERLRPAKIPHSPIWNWHDQGAAWWQWEPAGEFFSRAYRKGTVPLWDPTLAGGVDAHVNITQGQYFPPYVAVLLAGNSAGARDVYYLGLVLGAGVCLFTLCRRHGLHPLACATAACCFMLGGSMTLNVNSLVGQSIAVLPLLVLAMDLFVERPSWRRAGVLGLAVGFATLSSFMPVVICGLMLIGMQLVVHAFAAGGAPDAGRRARVRVAAIGAAGILIGLCTAAFLLLPVQLAAAADPRFTGWYRTSARQHFPLASWPALLSRVVPYSVSQGASPYEPPLGFGPVFDLGLVPVLLALLASGGEQPGRRSLAASFAIGGGFLLAKLFGLPPAQWIDRLPVLENLHFIPYGGGAVALAVSGLAGIGVDAMARRPPSRARAAIVTAAVAALGAYAVHFARTHTLSDARGLRDPVTEVLRLGLVAALVVAVIWLRRAGILGGPGTAALLLAAACIELVPLARQPRFYRAPVWSELPPYVRMLQEESARSRIHGAHPLALTPNMNQPLGLEAIGSRHALNSHRYDMLVRTYFKTDHAVYPVVADLLPSRRVILDLLNVKHLIAYRPNPGQLESLDAMGLPELYRDQSYVLLRNAHPWPRAYVATRVRLAADLAGAVGAVGDLATPDEVVLEEAPVATIAPQDVAPECQIRDYLPERVRLEAVSAAPAILVLSDAHMPGWTATVNGRAARILYANAAFRAVEIPAGRSEVEFNYVTPGLRAGIAISAAALVAIAALSWPRRRRA